MKEMIAYCGLKCHECETRQATIADDDKLRAEVAEKWSKMLNMELTAGDINCDGCLNREGVIFGHCSSCEIRACGMEKELNNCAECKEYPCSRLHNWFEEVPGTRETLDGLR